MKLQDALIDLLPTKAMRWVATATLATATVAYLAPKSLEALWSKSAPEVIFLAQCLAATVTALVGSLAIVCMLLREHHRLTSAPARVVAAPKPAPSPTPAPSPMSDDEVLFLQLLFHHPDLTAFKIAKVFEIPQQLVLYTLELLDRRGLVDTNSGMDGQYWYLTHEGRKYLVANGLEKKN